MIKIYQIMVLIKKYALFLKYQQEQNIDGLHIILLKI